MDYSIPFGESIKTDCEASDNHTDNRADSQADNWADNRADKRADKRADNQADNGADNQTVWLFDASQSVLIDSPNGIVHYFLLIFLF